MDIAISIRQPWAALIVLGFKDIENRTWAIPHKYRGKRVSVHAGQQFDQYALEEPGQPIKEAAAVLAAASGVDILEFLRRAKVHPQAFEFGGIVGRVTLQGCILNGSDSYWANCMEGTWHWQLAGARPVPFVQCKGALGFFDPTKEPTPAKPKQPKQASLLG
jgi:hypothetical protein